MMATMLSDDALTTTHTAVCRAASATFTEPAVTRATRVTRVTGFRVGEGQGRYKVAVCYLQCVCVCMCMCMRCAVCSVSPVSAERSMIAGRMAAAVALKCGAYLAARVPTVVSAAMATWPSLALITLSRLGSSRAKAASTLSTLLARSRCSKICAADGA